MADQFNNHLQNLAQRRADLRKPADYAFNWTPEEQRRRKQTLLAAAITEPVVWKCRDCHKEFAEQRNECIDCGCVKVDGVPF